MAAFKVLEPKDKKTPNSFMSTAFLLLEVKMASHCPLVGFWGLDHFAKTSGLDTIITLSKSKWTY